MDFFKKLFDSDFMPHGHCYFWSPEIVWTNAISDSIIAVAYLTIPLSLTYIVKTRKDFKYYWLLVLFAFFILGCGATHVMDVINIWNPVYRLDSLLRVITALASIGTAIMLVRFTPKILLIPSAENYKKLNEELRNQIEALKQKDNTIHLLTHLRQSEEKYRLVVDSIKDYAIFMLDEQGRIATWNDTASFIFGYNSDEIITKNISVLYPRELQSEITIDALLAGVIESGFIEAEGERVAKDGNRIWAHMTLASVYNEEKVCIGFSCIIKDLTQVRAAEQKQKNSVAQMLSIMNAMPIVVWTSEPDGNLDFYNQAWFEYTGFNFEQSINSGWKPVLHPDDLDSCIQVWTHSVQTGKPYQIEYRWKRASDNMYRWHLGRAISIKDDSGKIIKWIGSGTDIHDQKTTVEEIARKNNELTKINNDLDNFIYTASHDLKAPVSNIEGLLHALKDSFYAKSEPTEQQIIEMMQVSIDKFKVTIQDLTEISKLQRLSETDLQQTFFKEVINEVMFDLQTQVLNGNARVESNLKVDSVSFSKKNLRSIVYNLLSNAIKYRQADQLPFIKIHTYLKNQYVVLEVTDNGIGFDSAYKDKLFLMFKRLHNHVEGSGVGLYIVKRILDNAGGDIEVESTINEGSTFRIFLPMA